ncbi:hypothetical protein EST38_g7854 [Candolleomyces aberdarensis]|uniref:Protein kinase domain-containing protein n=1 Tax=Candolleomyces aberdarensis TaxID=2316362 RepID=A0A4Q2DG89_9AGAR|nr:hypothetical protein EST38_g7854 [Candolleomyces aberdarensis]
MLDTPAVTPSPEKVSEDEPAKQGSIVDDSDDGFEFICDEEPHMIRGPLAPGYASLYLGQRFTDLDRGPGPFPVSHPAQGYEIVRKLGWGEQGSVWLARRLENACQPSFAAIKVLTSSVSKAIIYDESFEMRALLRTARRVMSDHPGRPYCTLLLDAFLYQTPDSLHFCFVFEPLSFSLHEYVEVERRERGKFGFSVDGLRNIARQVLRAVSYIHGNGYIHTDIKSDNIFIDVGVSNEAIAKYLAEHASRTYPARQEPRVSLDHIITVMSEPLPPFSLPDRNGLRLKLGDLGAERDRQIYDSNANTVEGT